MDSCSCKYYLVVWANFNLMHNSLLITFYNQSCLTLYSFWGSLLHSLTMWLIVTYQSQHNLHLLFCCTLSILALISLVLMALFCAAIKRDLVSLVRFPSRSHVQVFSCEIVAWNIRTVVFLSIPVSLFLKLFYLSLRCQCDYRYYYTLYEFSTPVLVDCLSLETEWQQVSSGPQDSSQYSGRSQQYCNLNDLDFHLFQFLFHAFGDCSKCTNYNWYHRHPQVPQFCVVFLFFCFFFFCVCVFLVLWQDLSIRLSFPFFWFSLSDPLEWQNPLVDRILLLLLLLLISPRLGLLFRIWWSVCIPKSKRTLSVLFQGWILVI